MADKIIMKFRLRDAARLLPILLGCAVLLFAVGYFVIVSSPRYISLTPGEIKYRRLEAGDKVYVLIDGQPFSPTGQIQERGAIVNLDAKSIRIYAYTVLWNPFSGVVSHKNWPIILDITWLPAGEYKIECFVDRRYQEIGRINR